MASFRPARRRDGTSPVPSIGCLTGANVRPELSAAVEELARPVEEAPRGAARSDHRRTAADIRRRCAAAAACLAVPPSRRDRRDALERFRAASPYLAQVHDPLGGDRSRAPPRADPELPAPMAPSTAAANHGRSVRAEHRPHCRRRGAQCVASDRPAQCAGQSFCPAFPASACRLGYRIPIQAPAFLSERRAVRRRSRSATPRRVRSRDRAADVTAEAPRHGSGHAPRPGSGQAMRCVMRWAPPAPRCARRDRRRA
jgi:hypothetical protein